MIVISLMHYMAVSVIVIQKHHIQYEIYEIPVFCNHLEEEEKTGCFAIIVLQVYCYYKCSVVLPHGAVGWPAVYDCGIC